MTNLLNNSVSVYSKEYLNEKNISLLFVVDFVKNDDMRLFITGKNEFQVFLNGKLIAFGPAKAARNYHRVDEYELNLIDEKNRLLIVLSGYNVNSYDRINESPFLRFELYSGDKLIESSSLNTECYLNESRYQKVTRFSYQRNMSESYNNKFTNSIYKYGNKIDYKKVALIENNYGYFATRSVNYPKFDQIHYAQVERGFVTFNANKEHEDRYMFLDFLGLFKKEAWEINPNEVISVLDHHISKEKGSLIRDKEYLTFSNDYSLTGFVNLELDVKKESKIYVYFDEIRDLDFESIEFNAFRNTTHNIVTYELKPGSYKLTSFIPYTIKYAKVLCFDGETEVNDFSIIKLENPDAEKFTYCFEDKRIQNIMDAARRTFAQNALDILTDCPSRERAGWLCDSYFSSRAEILFTGENKVEKSFLENYANFESQGIIDDGMIPMCYPSDELTGDYIPNWSMFYVLELRNYFKRIDDKKLKEDSAKNIRSLLNFFKKYINEIGLLENLENWVFVEWSEANSPESIKGVNLPSNMLYANFLIASGELLNEFDLIDQGKKIIETIREVGYNGKFFVDNLVRDENNRLVQNNRICETTQYYAFYFGVACKNSYPELFSIIINDFGPNRDCEKVYKEVFKSNVFIGDYLRLEILLKYGYYTQILSETVDYFNKMAIATGTLWEHDSNFASCNHGFASFIANLVVSCVTGIDEIDYLNKTVYVNKEFSSDYIYEMKIPLGNEVLLVRNSKEKGIEFITESDYKIDYVKRFTE